MYESLQDQVSRLVKRYGAKKVLQMVESFAKQRAPRSVSKPRRQAAIPKAERPPRAGVEELLALHRNGQFLRELREYRQFVSDDHDTEVRPKTRSMARLRSVLETLSDDQLAALIADSGSRPDPFDAIVRSVVGEPRARNTDR